MSCLADGLPRIVKARHNNYASLLDESTREKLVSLLTQEGRIPCSLYQQIHRAKAVPIPNLKRWRKEILNGCDPFDHSWRQRPRALPKEAEDDLLDCAKEDVLRCSLLTKVFTESGNVSWKEI